MQRKEFISRISLTALLLSGFRNELKANSKKDESTNSTSEFVIPTYPMDRVSDILSDICSKIYSVNIELEEFLDTFAQELELRFPLKKQKPITSYQKLYFLCLRMEIISELTILIIGIWQNLSLRIGLDGYSKEEFFSDSETIKNAMIRFGSENQTYYFSLFLDKGKENHVSTPFQLDLSLPWLGGDQKESIFANFSPMEFVFSLEPAEFSKSMDHRFQMDLYGFLDHTQRFQFQLEGARARWHQYVVRYSYMSDLQYKFETKRELKDTQSSVSALPIFLRYYGFESAMNTIQERAYHMQSGVYHFLDRQSQQMVVSSLVIMMKNLNLRTNGNQKWMRSLRLENQDGSILSVSTMDLALQTYKSIEEGIHFLRQERKKYLTREL